MQQPPLKNQVIDWLDGQDYWLQYAGNLLLEGAEVSTGLVETTFELFKEDHGLKTMTGDRIAVSFNRITINGAASASPLQLLMVKEIEHVNALAPGQAIVIGGQLTLIYGPNGAGKTGYIRLFNNAFNSRGDKNMLHNVFGTGPAGTPTCKFSFQADADPFDVSYPADKANPVFSQFAVFDSKSVSVHLEQDNKLNFIPTGFEFFEKILALYEALKAKLQAEISSKKKPNEFAALFANENEIKTLVSGLSAATKTRDIRAAGTYTQVEVEAHAGLSAKKEALRALDIPKKIGELQLLSAQLTDFTGKIKGMLDCLTIESIESCQSLINNFHQTKELATREGLTSLKTYNVEAAGTDEWKAFIRASRNYAATIETSRGENGAYPAEGDRCLYCLQPLADRELELIEAYWNLLKGEAESALLNITVQLAEKEKTLARMGSPKFDETSTLYEYIHEADPGMALRWKDIVQAARQTLQTIITGLGNKVNLTGTAAITAHLREFDPIADKLKSAIATLIEKNPSKDLADLEKQIQLLNDKNLLSKLLDKILLYLADLAWAAKAESAISAFNTKSITMKQGELFAAHITNHYTRIFNEECSKLNAPKIVAITQKNAKGSTLRKLQVAGLAANSILSEGEQRAISLADFFTEAQLNPINKGVIFDDPVTSQDHMRKENIAKRLVELSGGKQVIVFTHDIGFFLRLTALSEEAGIKTARTTIRNFQGTPGIIHPDLPWVAQNTTARIGTLKDRLVRLKKTEKVGNPDDYLFQVKTWYGLLREAWERLVEERLLKGVVERFLPGVQTQKLKKIVITQELVAAVEKGMTDSSNWVHDAAAGHNPTPPDTTKAEEDLKFFEEVAKSCPAP